MANRAMYFTVFNEGSLDYITRRVLPITDEMVHAGFRIGNVPVAHPRPVHPAPVWRQQIENLEATAEVFSPPAMAETSGEYNLSTNNFSSTGFTYEPTEGRLNEFQPAHNLSVNHNHNHSGDIAGPYANTYIPPDMDRLLNNRDSLDLHHERTYPHQTRGERVRRRIATTWRSVKETMADLKIDN